MSQHNDKADPRNRSPQPPAEPSVGIQFKEVVHSQFSPHQAGSTPRRCFLEWTPFEEGLPATSTFSLINVSLLNRRVPHSEDVEEVEERVLTIRAPQSCLANTDDAAGGFHVTRETWKAPGQSEPYREAAEIGIGQRMVKLLTEKPVPAAISAQEVVNNAPLVEYTPNPCRAIQSQQEDYRLAAVKARARKNSHLALTKPNNIFFTTTTEETPTTTPGDSTWRKDGPISASECPVPTASNGPYFVRPDHQRMDLSKSDKFEPPTSKYVQHQHRHPAQPSFYVRPQATSLVSSDSEEDEEENSSSSNSSSYTASSSSTSGSSSSTSSLTSYSRTCSCSSDEGSAGGAYVTGGEDSTWRPIVDTGFHNLPANTIRIESRSASAASDCSHSASSGSTTCSQPSREVSPSSTSVQQRGLLVAPRTYSYPPATQACRLYPHPHPGTSDQVGLGLNTLPTLSLLPMRCSSNYSNSGRQTPVINMEGGERSEASVEERALTPQGGGHSPRSPSPASSGLQATVVLRQTSVRRRPASPSFTAGQRRRLDVEWERVDDDGALAVSATPTTADDREFASMNVSVSTRRTISPTVYMNATSRSPEPEAPAATAPEAPMSSGLTTRFYSGTERTLSPTAMVDEVEERTIIIQTPVADSQPPSLATPDTPTPRSGSKINVVTDATATDREIVHSAIVDIGNKKVRILSQEPLDGLTKITDFTATNEIDVDKVPLRVPDDWPVSLASCETKSASIGFREKMADVKSTTEIVACNPRSPTPMGNLVGKSGRSSPALTGRSDNDAYVRSPEVTAVALQKDGSEDPNVLLTKSVIVNGVDASQGPPGANIMLVRKDEGFNLRIAVSVNIESEEVENVEAESVGELSRPQTPAAMADTYIREPTTKGPAAGRPPDGVWAPEQKEKIADAAESFEGVTESESEADKHKVPPGPLVLAHSLPSEGGQLGEIKRTDQLEQPAPPTASPPPTEWVKEDRMPEHNRAGVNPQDTPEIPQQQLSQPAESSQPMPPGAQPDNAASGNQPNAADQLAAVGNMPQVGAGSEMQHSGLAAEESTRRSPGPDEQLVAPMEIGSTLFDKVASSREVSLVPTEQLDATQPQEVNISVHIEFTTLSASAEDEGESPMRQAIKGETPKSIEPVTSGQTAPWDDTMLMSPQKTVSTLSEQAVEEVIYEEPQQAAEDVSATETHADFGTERQMTEEDRNQVPVLDLTKMEEVDNDDGVMVTADPITGDIDISMRGGALNPEDDLDIAIINGAESGQMGIRIREGSQVGSPATEFDIVINTESADTEQMEVEIQENVYMIPEGAVAGPAGMEIAIASNDVTGDVELQIRTLGYSVPVREEEAALVSSTPVESVQVMSESEAPMKVGADMALTMSSSTEEVEAADVELLHQPTPHGALSEVDMQINEPTGVLQVRMSEMQTSEVEDSKEITIDLMVVESGPQAQVQHMVRMETAEMDLEIIEEMIETGEEVVYERVSNIGTPDGALFQTKESVRIQSHQDDEVVLSIVSESGVGEVGPTDTTVITIGADPGQALSPDQLTNGPFTLDLQIIGPNDGDVEIVIEGTEMLSPRSEVPTIAAVGGAEAAIASTVVSEATTLPQTSGTLGAYLVSPTPDATFASGHTSPLIFQGQISISLMPQSLEDNAGAAFTATPLPADDAYTVHTRAQVATEITTYTDKETGQLVIDSIKPIVAVSSNAPKTIPLSSGGVIPITAHVSMDAIIRTSIDPNALQAGPPGRLLTKDSATGTDARGLGGRFSTGRGLRAPLAHRCSSLYSETTCFWRALTSRTCSMRQQQTKATNQILDSLILDTLKTLKQRQRPTPVPTPEPVTVLRQSLTQSATQSQKTQQ